MLVMEVYKPASDASPRLRDKDWRIFRITVDRSLTRAAQKPSRYREGTVYRSTEKALTMRAALSASSRFGD